MARLILPSSGVEQAYKSFREHNSDCLRYLRLIETDWPYAIDIMLKLCAYLTDALLVNDRPVTHRAIASALSRYSKSLGGADPIRLTAFVESLIDSLGRDLQNLAVIDRARDDVWSPLSSVSFGDWLSQEGRLSRLDGLATISSDCLAEDISIKMFEDLIDEPHQEIICDEADWLKGAVYGY